VFRGFCGEDPHALGSDILVEGDTLDTPQISGMVFRLETEVSLNVDLDVGVHPCELLSQLLDVFPHKGKLPGWICMCQMVRDRFGIWVPEINLGYGSNGCPK